jgi:ABC-2 type transport system ATP-binding protein
LPRGVVAGFIGPNGAGKTTTMAMLLGLVRPTSGSGTVLGEPLDRPERYLGKVGALVEGPALWPALTAVENLRVLARLGGNAVQRIPEVLDLVGLTERAGDRFGTYSLGMKQRLGIAAALLGDPALLVLDEPANGLDPAGIRQVRALMRQLADEGRTVFVSSHILSEIEHICDRVAILSRGSCVAQGTVLDVLASARKDEAMLVKVDDLAAGTAVLQSAGLRAEQCDGHVRIEIAAAEAHRVTQILARGNQWVTELRPEEHSLEELFLELTEGNGVTAEADRLEVGA